MTTNQAVMDQSDGGSMSANHTNKSRSGERVSSTASHTPGPWTLEQCSHGGLILVRGGYTHPQPMLQIVPKADARLIAAAPEMLAALQAVLSEWREGYGLKCVDQVRTAIAKAAGTVIGK